MPDVPHLIDSPEAMLDAIRHFGIIPFFHNAVSGWSIEDLTAPGCWFGDENDGGSLGPWDWKIDTVRAGDIAYGKYLGGKAAFATFEWYRHLMNWRRSLPQHKLAEGGHPEFLLEAIKKNGSLQAQEMRALLKPRIPDIKKQTVDSLLQHLEMGTWAVIGDFTRVYRGPNLVYSGWQRSSVTTPDELFKPCVSSGGESDPFWAKFIDNGPASELPSCSPEESRETLITHIRSLFPEAKRNIIEKMI